MFETLVIDNFLNAEEQEIIRQNLLMRAKWEFLYDMNGDMDSKHPSYGFVHVFTHPNEGVMSEFYTALLGMFSTKLKKIVDYKEINYVRSFLQLPLESKHYKERNNVHVDIPQNHIAAVYYVTDSDGDTVIYDNRYGETVTTLKRHKTVTPKAGRIVFFDGSRFHCSSQPTDKLRCIINFDLVV
jgi:Rps23 Pro-64 3,4-dihydroxylase Tpa1-like proline 4-hydroxylase